MNYSICSYSFHRSLEEAKHDIYQYIRDCEDFRCSQLDPWSAHLPELLATDSAIREGRAGSKPSTLSDQERGYLEEVRRAQELSGIPFGCIAVDGAHVYEDDEELRVRNRAVALRWIMTAAILGASQVRIDAGCRGELTDDVMDAIARGYSDLVKEAGSLGVEVLTENHWGATREPENMLRILDSVSGLGLLFDTRNLPEDRYDEGCRMLAPRARAVHIKTVFDPESWEDELSSRAIECLKRAGYSGCWGIESVSDCLDEYEGVRRSIALLREHVGEKQE